MKVQVLRPNFEKRGGLITAVAQDVRTKTVLMSALVNEEAWLMSLATGIATYWSTSRNELWVKGATSNNQQEIVDIYIDCDGDTIIYLVHPQGHGVACHTNAYSCFFRSIFRKDELICDAPNRGKKEDLAAVEAEVIDRLVEVPC